MKTSTLTLIVLGIAIGSLLTWLLLDRGDTEATVASAQPLYWVAPMDPNYRRDQPGKSPMGMDLVPVYPDDAASRTPGTVVIPANVMHNLGVRTAPEFLFSVFCVPVGAYFKGGLTPANFIVSPYDRAAPHGTGAAKVGGNYAASLLPGHLAKERGFADAIYLDPQTHTKIEEVGAANFFAITQDDRFVTPQSPSILPSITKFSLLQLARERLGLEVEEGDIYIDQLDRYKEAGACGTAA